MKIKDLLSRLAEYDIFEGKQVGTLYHFTTIENLLHILDMKKLVGPNGYISLTRNFNLSSEDLVGHNKINLEQFKNNPFHFKAGYIVRLAFDGDRISNRFKISPLLGSTDKGFDFTSRVSRHSQEREEAISTTVLSLEYLKQIDILLTSSVISKIYKDIGSILDDMKIKHFGHKKWLPIMEDSGECNITNKDAVILE